MVNAEDKCDSKECFCVIQITVVLRNLCLVTTEHSCLVDFASIGFRGDSLHKEIGKVHQQTIHDRDHIDSNHEFAIKIPS